MNIAEAASCYLEDIPLNYRRAWNSPGGKRAVSAMFLFKLSTISQYQFFTLATVFTLVNYYLTNYNPPMNPATEYR